MRELVYLKKNNKNRLKNENEFDSILFIKKNLKETISDLINPKKSLDFM